MEASSVRIVACPKCAREITPEDYFCEVCGFCEYCCQCSTETDPEDTLSGD